METLRVDKTLLAHVAILVTLYKNNPNATNEGYYRDSPWQRFSQYERFESEFLIEFGAYLVSHRQNARLSLRQLRS